MGNYWRRMNHPLLQYTLGRLLQLNRDRDSGEGGEAHLTQKADAVLSLEMAERFPE